MNFAEFFAAYNDQVKKAREGKLAIEDFQGTTISLTNPGTIGNPWFVTTLWRAQYYLELNMIPEATRLIDWVRAAMLPSGVLPEQVRATSGAYLSVAPLAWSQAEFVSTLIDLVTETTNKDV